MRESLRLGPTAPARTAAAIEDTTVLGGKYAVEKDTAIMLNIMQAHRDPKVWGEDVRDQCILEWRLVLICVVAGGGVPSGEDDGWQVRGPSRKCPGQG